MPKTQKPVSLTTFVDFVSRVGLPRITVVKDFKDGQYQPAFDFYKAVREAIVDLHETGKSKKALDAVLTGLKDPKKVAAYTSVVQGHRKFIGKNTMNWFDPPKAKWAGGGIDITINPELGLVIDGKEYVIKLYFKEEPLPKKNVPIITRLMEKSLSNGSGVSPIYAVLDVRRSRLHTPNKFPPGIDGFLAGEAGTFALILASL